MDEDEGQGPPPMSPNAEDLPDDQYAVRGVRKAI